MAVSLYFLGKRDSLNRETHKSSAKGGLCVFVLSKCYLEKSFLSKMKG